MNKVKCAFCVSFEMFFSFKFHSIYKKQFVRAKTLYMRKRFKYAQMYSNRLTIRLMSFLFKKFCIALCLLLDFYCSTIMRIKSVDLTIEYRERDDFRIS